METGPLGEAHLPSDTSDWRATPTSASGLLPILSPPTSNVIFPTDTLDSDGKSFSAMVREAIAEKMKRNWHDQKFISHTDLHRIMSHETIFRLITEDRSLKNVTYFSAADFAHDVHLQARRLIAICTYSRIPLEFLLQLRKGNIADVNLPLHASDLPALLPSFEKDSLLLLQGAFFAHEFPANTTRPQYVELPHEVVVPVMSDRDKDRVGAGSFGEVYKVHIDPAHHHFSPHPDEPFALKQFFYMGLQTSDDFQREALTLELLSGIPHPNIVTHLAAWRQDERFHMLFPLAESNLRAYLRKSSPVLTKSNFLSIISQMKGLAEGIRLIHNLGPSSLGSGDPAVRRTGYHHDLKPSNILVFRYHDADHPDDTGEIVLKISDFGTAKFGALRSGSLRRSNSRKTMDLGAGDVVYAAPDFIQEGKTSRPYDMWSLGCIFLEIMIWTLGSPHVDLNTFQEQRFKTPESFGRNTNSDGSFWFVDQSGVVHLKPAVVEELVFLENYCKDCKDRGVLRRLLRTITRLLSIKPKVRPTASVLCNDLDEILMQAKFNLRDHPDFYLQDPKPRLALVAPPSGATDSRQSSVDDLTILPRLTVGRSFPGPVRPRTPETLIGHHLEFHFPDSSERLRDLPRSLDPTIGMDYSYTLLSSEQETETRMRSRTFVSPPDPEDFSRPTLSVTQTPAHLTKWAATPSGADDDDNTGVVGHPNLLLRKPKYISNTSRKRHSGAEGGIPRATRSAG
jgi:serine/threonine protein kinase